MKRLVRKLLESERGQDVIEYGLLTATIGVAGGATWPLLSATIGEVYNALNTSTQDLWVPPDPGAGGGP